MASSTPSADHPSSGSDDSLPVDSGWSTVPPSPPDEAPLSKHERDPETTRLDQDSPPRAPARPLTGAAAQMTMLGVAPPSVARPGASEARRPVLVRSGVAKPGLPTPPVPLPKRSVTPPAPRVMPEPIVEKPFVPEKAVELAPQPTTASPNDSLLVALTSSPPRRSTPPLPVPAPFTGAPPTPMPLAVPLETRTPAFAEVGPQLPEVPFTAPLTPMLSPPAVAETVLAPRRIEVASLGQALAARVRVVGLELPLWAPMAALMGLVATGVAVVALVSGPRSGAAQVTATPPAPTLSPPSAAVAPPTAPSVREAAPVNAKDGESAALLALADATAQKELQAAKEFRERMKRDPAVLKDKTTLTELRQLIQDPDTAREALGAIAEVPGPLSADLLYEIWTGTPNRTDATELARALVYAPDVRGKASPSLSVALDLRRAETCEQNRDLLARAATDGDRRSFNLLAKLKRKQGCGPNKRQDCNSCLREGTELDDAIKAVKTKRAPTAFGS